MKPKQIGARRLALSALAFTLLASSAGASGDAFKDALFSDRTGFLLQIPLPGRTAPPTGRATDGLADQFGTKLAYIVERQDLPASVAAN
jgi:hypothetical protein